MKGEERRKKIEKILSQSEKPISGAKLAKNLNVSRQVVVQDIALMRQGGIKVLSTNRGYYLQQGGQKTRVFKVIHSDEDTAKELCSIVDLGGRVIDVFVYHRVYGLLRAPLNINSRRDVENYIDSIKHGASTLLKNTTSGYHYHTVSADSEAILDLIQDKLSSLGFLAKLQDYEPVDFWNDDAVS